MKAETCKKVFSWAALGFFLVQLVYIIFINLFKSSAWIDHDASMLYSHTMHMWEQGRFVIPFYQEETFLHIDTSCLLAMPLYGLTKNIFLSYGIANVIFLLATLFVMHDLMKNIGVRKEYGYIAMAMYLIPYRVGLVQYTNMLYYECSFYNVCILATVLGIDLFLYPEKNMEEKRGKITYYILLAFYAFFLALTAFSRGTYLLLVAIAPVLLCYVLEVILSEDGFSHIRRSRIVVVAVSVVSYAAGLVLGKITGYTPKVTGYTLVMARKIFDNFVRVFWGHLSLFLGNEEPSVLTSDGIMFLILLGYAFLMIILIIFNLKHAFKEHRFANALRYLTIIYIWNFVILGLTNCSTGDWAFPERYLLPGFIPLLLSVPVMLTYMEDIKRDLLKKTAELCVYALTILTLIVCDIGVITSFRTNADELKGIREVLAYAKGSGINTVFFLNDDNAGLLSRCLEPDMRVVSIETHDDGTYSLRARENYMCAHDRAYYGDENILAVKWDDQPENSLLEYQLSSYQYVADVEDYHLYHAGSDKFDDRAGFPLNDNVLDTSIDYCHTKGYQTLGELNLYGHLIATGVDNYVLISPQLDAPYRTCNVTLQYDVDQGDGVVGSFMLLGADNAPVTSAEIKSGSSEATLTVDTKEPCYLAVWLNNPNVITIKEIDYAAVYNTP